MKFGDFVVWLWLSLTQEVCHLKRSVVTEHSSLPAVDRVARCRTPDSQSCTQRRDIQQQAGDTELNSSNQGSSVYVSKVLSILCVLSLHHRNALWLYLTTPRWWCQQLYVHLVALKELRHAYFFSLSFKLVPLLFFRDTQYFVAACWYIVPKNGWKFVCSHGCRIFIADDWSWSQLGLIPVYTAESFVLRVTVTFPT